MKTSRITQIKNELRQVLLQTRIGMTCRLPVLLLLASMVAVHAGDFSYMINNDQTVTITGYTGPGGAVTIPNAINNLPVVSIGQMAFYRCASLASVLIPNGVTSIKASAFYSCISLTSVTIPNSVVSIEASAFYSCTSLASVTIQDNSPGGSSAFYSYPRLANIGDSAFYSCTSLTKICFEGNAPILGSNVFAGDNNLTVYYVAGTTGWGPTFGGRPTAQ